MSERVTPDPIPNSAVKPLSANDSVIAKVGRRLDNILSFFISKFSRRSCVYCEEAKAQPACPASRERRGTIYSFFLFPNLVEEVRTPQNGVFL